MYGGSRMRTLKILVVDDELGMRLGIKRALEGYTAALPDIEGEVVFTVIAAESGEEGLERIQADRPDLLLLDQKLPGISGLDVLSKLGELEPDLLTVMITAYASLQTAVIATKKGAYDFLAKPFTPADLKAAVRKAARHLLVQREAKRLADEKHQVRFQFISVLAHELKSPLAAIQGYLYLMRDGSMGPDMASYETAVLRSLVRIEDMRKLIGDLLDLTRIESGKKTRDFQEVDMIAVAEHAFETMAPAADDQGITMKIHGPEALWVMADQGEMEIVINNLVSNGVKYNQKNGRVDVTFCQEVGSLGIEVADTGIGMTKKETAKLFGEFVRIKNSKTRKIPGSGLGLSIVKKLARLYKGDVKVESVPDEGTKFIVNLELEPTAPPETEG
jgi:two-component system, sensor histidine kinase and response regulator